MMYEMWARCAPTNALTGLEGAWHSPLAVMSPRSPTTTLASHASCFTMAVILLALACAVSPNSKGAAASSTGKEASLAVAARVPEARWSLAPDPDQLGWSEVGLRRAGAMLEDLGTAAFLVVTDGQIVFSHGRISTRFKMHSIRKSLLSALLGISIHEGRIDPAASLGDLGIDDNSPRLTAEEKQATVSSAPPGSGSAG